MNAKRLPVFMLLFFFLGSTLTLFAQNITVRGKVTDSKTSKPLVGVSVKVKNSTQAAVTGEDGTFSIKVPSTESVITVTYIGYAVYERKVGSTTFIEISLTETTSLLDDVVVVGYGTKKRTNVLGAVATIKAEDIEDLPVANLGATLINRLPGVGVSITSGKPGATTSINIRNAATFSGSTSIGSTASPLYVIDGLTVDAVDFNNLDASLIENITILKDAAAAIYGASGAKGVVLVTTKKGRVGKPRISYTGYFGTSTPSTVPKVMSAYEHAKMLNDGYELNNSQLSSRFSQADLAFLATNPYKSWYDELWNPGTVSRHTINITGGTEKITFFGGGNTYNETGNYGGISLKKYGIRAGMSAKITPDLTASVQMSTDLSRDERHTLKGASDETDDLTIRALFLTPKWVPLTINGLPVNWSGPNPPGAWNPVALENSGNYKWQKSQGLGLNATIEYKPSFLQGLSAKVQYGKNNRNANHKEYFPPYKIYNFVRGGQNLLLYTNTPTSSPTSNVSNSDQLGESSTITSSYQLIGTLAYTKKLKNQEFDLMVAVDQSESFYENTFFYRNGQIISGVDQFWAFSTASSTIRNPAYTQAANRSYIGRLNYSLLNKYLVEFIVRRDASSNFNAGNVWGTFPSLMLGWKVSEENFFRKSLPFINYFKLRGSYGLVGDARVSELLWRERYSQTTGMLFGTTVTNGLDPSIYPNADITWEKSRMLNVGFDATVLKNKINLAVDFWNRFDYDGFDVLTTSALAATYGGTAAAVNYGKRLTWGSEFSIGYNGKINKDWGFKADVVFGFGNSMLLQSYYNTSYLGTYGTNEQGVMVGRDPKKYNGSNLGYIAKDILRTQEQVDAILAKNPNYKIGGAKPQVGFLDFEDINGDGQIDDKDIVPMFENTSTRLGMGITLGVTYKSFKLSTNIVLNIGGKKFYDTEARKVPTTTQNAPSFWADHWTPDNPNAKFPRADAPLAKENSTLWAVDGTNCRVNNMTLSYTMPKRISEKLGIPEFRAFLTGTNLWNIINPFKYKDPYTSNFANYPTLRTISVGLNVSM